MIFERLQDLFLLAFFIPCFPVIFLKVALSRIFTKSPLTFLQHFAAIGIRFITGNFPIKFIRFLEHLKPPQGIKVTKHRHLNANWIGEILPKPARTIIYFHGGGFCIGHSTLQIEAFKYLRENIIDCNILSVDYPLAPENPYPAALNYAVHVYETLILEGYKDLIFAGDSAGGSIAITTLYKLVKTESKILPSGLLLISPGIDIFSLIQEEGHDMLSRSFLKVAIDAYVGNNQPSDLISPTHASDAFLQKVFNSKVRVLITLGELESIKPSIDKYISRLRGSGFKNLIVLEKEGMLHVYPLMPLVFTNHAYETLGDIVSWINKLPNA